MAAHGARRLMEMTRNLAHIIGIELVVAAQGIDLRKAGHGFDKLGAAPPLGLKTSPPLERVLAVTRQRIATLGDDRILSGDLAAAAQLVNSGAITAAAGHGLLPGLGFSAG
jgi:histidine ammonia-lyase